MTPLPRLSTSSLRPLNPATSHNNNNNYNNNGRLHACVGAAEDTETIRVTGAKYSAALPLRWAKKDYGQPTSRFRLLLVMLGFFYYCLYSAHKLYAQNKLRNRKVGSNTDGLKETRLENKSDSGVQSFKIASVKINLISSAVHRFTPNVGALYVKVKHWTHKCNAKDEQEMEYKNQ